MPLRINKIIQYFSSDKEFNIIFKKTSLSIPIQVLGMICSMSIGVFIARAFGPEGVGIVDLSRRIVDFAVLLSLCGAPLFIVKSIAALLAADNEGEINNFLLSFLFYVVVTSVVLTGLIFLFSDFISAFLENEKLTKYLRIFVLNITPLAITFFFSFGLNGKKLVVWSTFFLRFFGPFIVVLVFAIIYLFSFKITLLNTLNLITISNYVACLITVLFWFKRNPLKNIKIDLKWKNTLAKSYPFLLIGLFNFIYLKIDIFIIEYFLNTKQVGLYSTAFRLGMLLSIAHIVVARAATPTIAHFIHTKQYFDLEKLLQKFSKALFGIALITFLVFIAFGKKILGIWGDPFVAAYSSLLFIVAAESINILTGYTGIVLVMGNYESLVYKISLLFIPINLLLNIILIPFFGILGAAISYFIVVVSFNIVKYIIVRSKFKINPVKIF